MALDDFGDRQGAPAMAASVATCCCDSTLHSSAGTVNRRMTILAGVQDKGALMSTDEGGDLEARVSGLEVALMVARSTAEKNRLEIAAVRTLLSTLIDSLRPDDPAEEREWLDTLLQVATGNVDLYTEVVQARMIRDHGADREMYETLERERDVVTKMLTEMIGALKNPTGEVR